MVKFDGLITLFEFGWRLLVQVAINRSWVLNLLLVFRHEVEVDDGVSHADVLNGWNVAEVHVCLIFAIQRMASSRLFLYSFRLNRVLFSIKLHGSLPSFRLVWLAPTPSAARFTVLSGILIFEVMLAHCVCLLIFRQLLNALLLAFFTADSSYSFLLRVLLSTFSEMVHL